MNKGGDYPRKYWWVVLVIIPVILALIGILPQLCRSPIEESNFVTPPEESKSDTTNNILQLKMHKAGWSDFETGERIYEFDLYNNAEGIAVVRCIILEVLAIEREGPPQVEAILAKAEYHIVLDHKKVSDYVITKHEYKYAKGDIDKFAVGVKSDKPGWRYMLRIKVIWYNPEEEGERILYSKPYVARFYRASLF